MKLICKVSSFTGRHERLVKSLLKVWRLEVVVCLAEDVCGDDISRKG